MCNYTQNPRRLPVNVSGVPWPEHLAIAAFGHLDLYNFGHAGILTFGTLRHLDIWTSKHLAFLTFGIWIFTFGLGLLNFRKLKN